MNRLNYFLVFLIILISCNTKPKEDISGEVLKDTSQFKSESQITFFEFQDTVTINQDILGEIKYNLGLDDLKLSDIDKRYTFFYVTTQKEALDLESIKNTSHNIFIDTVGNGTFYFNAKFTNYGNNLLNGVIEDIIYLKGITNEGKVKIIKKKTNISKDVFVKEQ
ncbi:MAG: hypothetical protein L3J20_01760 [Flavobacteriaceae bacterium]|nr:hypothetical protein [Flavobacteriaceae bacterium]